MFEGSKLSPWGKALIIAQIMTEGALALLVLHLTFLLALYVDWAQMFTQYE